jgi:hypothetical protein
MQETYTASNSFAVQSIQAEYTEAASGTLAIDEAANPSPDSFAVNDPVATFAQPTQAEYTEEALNPAFNSLNNDATQMEYTEEVHAPPGETFGQGLNYDYTLLFPLSQTEDALENITDLQLGETLDEQLFGPPASDFGFFNQLPFSESGW